MRKTDPSRCAWVKMGNPAYVAYHDTEWGVPSADDRTLFEFMVLESAQAGLSWETILNRRDGYRNAFCNFDPARVAQMAEKDIARLMRDSGIIRNERKIRSAIKNAQAFLIAQKEFGSFAHYLWAWTGGKSLQTKRRKIAEIPATTPLSIAMSKDLKKRGFAFLGPTICYAFMQAVGMVNDHTVDCFRHREVASLAPFEHRPL
jgi:DNA-3-methyladenine glycosylase I